LANEGEAGFVIFAKAKTAVSNEVEMGHLFPHFFQSIFGREKERRGD
jgi:hypothetical protein